MAWLQLRQVVARDPFGTGEVAARRRDLQQQVAQRDPPDSGCVVGRPSRQRLLERRFGSRDVAKRK
jgi:hypothetical protein